METRNIEVANLCINHKPSEALNNPNFYHIQVGAQSSDIDLGVHRDDQGDNISFKNPNYCELTGLYWFWKNAASQYDVVAMNHYRRFFLNDDEEILSASDVEQLLTSYDIIMPYPKHYPVSIKQQYQIMHEASDFDILERVVAERYPHYKTKEIWETNQGFLYNMFVMSRADFDKAMSFIFDVLTEVEKRVDISGYDQQQARIFGFMAERLLSLYVQMNFDNIKYLPVAFTDSKGQKNVIKENAGILDIIFKLQKPFASASNVILKSLLTSKSK